MNKILMLLFVISFGCSSNLSENKRNTNKNIHTKTKTHKIDIKIENKGSIKVGDILQFSYKTNAKSEPDSIKLTLKNKHLNTFYAEKFSWNSKDANTGKQKLNFVFYWGDSIQQTVSKKLTLLSDIIPINYSYKVKQTWPHSTKAYTQGLEFSDGYLYEGTGEYGQSMLTKIKLSTNEIIQSINLPNDFFGEGITILNDKIYQITWKSSIGFVYRKENLQKLYDFNYPTDGWGLTNNGKELIMSDGSETIYFLDTEYFSEVKRIEVYDNQGLVNNLNELELIDTLVYANIYGTNNIVAFDVNSGKVVKRINLTGLLNKSNIKTRVDVLNGIAWNNEEKQLVVTGKWWPKLYEIELIEKVSN